MWQQVCTNTQRSAQDEATPRFRRACCSQVRLMPPLLCMLVWFITNLFKKILKVINEIATQPGGVHLLGRVGLVHSQGPVVPTLWPTRLTFELPPPCAGSMAAARGAPGSELGMGEGREPICGDSGDLQKSCSTASVYLVKFLCFQNMRQVLSFK